MSQNGIFFFPLPFFSVYFMCIALEKFQMPKNHVKRTLVKSQKQEQKFRKAQENTFVSLSLYRITKDNVY